MAEGGGGGGCSLSPPSGVGGAETQLENCEVEVFGTSVAVSVKKWDAGMTRPSRVAEKSAEPEASVSTSSPVLARKDWPSPNPEGSQASLLKNSRS